ncbi:MAG: hypothetical protein Fur0042_22030 [Cyanophyceae cyanobacterium]
MAKVRDGAIAAVGGSGGDIGGAEFTVKGTVLMVRGRAALAQFCRFSAPIERTIPVECSGGGIRLE